MDHFGILILVGLIIGTCGTLIGAGGGFLLVPLLLLSFPQLSPEVVTGISIAVVAANAISGTVAYARSGRIDYKAGIVFAVFTIPGSIIGVYLTNYIPRRVFDVGFGVLLVVLSAYLFIKNRKPKAAVPEAALPHSDKLTHHTLTDAGGKTFSYAYNQTLGIIISVLVGFISPLLGIGGGIIHVPAMVQWLQFPVYIATATSHFILAIMATISVAVHFFNGDYESAQVLRLIGGLAIGVIPGAQLGAALSHRIPTGVIIKVLAVCLALVALRVLWSGLG
ncbi:MAG: sulfite exporter TauE/SafE family protein [Sphingobacteriales bacterium]|nr:MAG: sulfite exporter TauE/SafE family protein [Sphingobacteriales bacterium]